MKQYVIQPEYDEIQKVSTKAYSGFIEVLTYDGHLFRYEGWNLVPSVVKDWVAANGSVDYPGF